MFVKIAENEWINMENIGKTKESEVQVRINGEPKKVKGITLFDLKHDYFDSIPIDSPEAKAILKWLEGQEEKKEPINTEAVKKEMENIRRGGVKPPGNNIYRQKAQEIFSD